MGNRKMRLRSICATTLAALSVTPCVLAANFEFEGVLRDGRTVSFSTEAPSRVVVFQRAKDGSIKNYGTYENEHCEVTDSVLSCSSSGKSPLAGTTYRFHRLVGKQTDCASKSVYAIYQRTKGCSKSGLAPSTLNEGSFCG